MWLVGAAIATVRSQLLQRRIQYSAPCPQSYWGNLHWCHVYKACRILTALVAFAWMGWIILLFLIVISITFAVVNGAFGHPMHGRYDPRTSTYSTRRF